MMIPVTPTGGTGIEVSSELTRLEVFLKQLDGLVVFLAAAREEVFDLIHSNELTWFPVTQDPLAPETAESYRHSICNAAFLLGYAYLESFLADVAREVYLRRPAMMPDDGKLTYKDVVSAKCKNDLLQVMAGKAIRSVFGGSIEEVLKCFTNRLNIMWPDEPRILTASRVRNCIMHNGGVVDSRLAEADACFIVGSTIVL